MASVDNTNSDKTGTDVEHDFVIKWKHFPRYWPFVRGIQWFPVNSRTKASDAGLWCFLDLLLNKRHDLENITGNFTPGLEIVIIEATVRTKERWIYVVGHKPPGIQDMTFCDVFSTLCDLILQESTNIVILGDYNCDFMADSPLKDICVTFDLQNLVTEPTCFKNQDGSLIDLCLVSNPTRFKKALNLDCWLSDWHNFICITTKLFAPHQKPNVITYRSFKNFVDKYFIYDLYHLLESLDFNNSDCINTCFKRVVDCMDDIVNYHAPWKTKTIKEE